MKKCLPPARKNRFVDGFSLIEVTLALGLVSFAIIPIIGVLAMGFTSYRSASEISAEAVIVQNIRSQSASLTNSGQLLSNMYFEIDGTKTSNIGSAAYEATSTNATFAKLSGTDSATLINKFLITRLASHQVIAEGVIHITPR